MEIQRREEGLAGYLSLKTTSGQDCPITRSLVMRKNPGRSLEQKLNDQLKMFPRRDFHEVNCITR